MIAQEATKHWNGLLVVHNCWCILDSLILGHPCSWFLPIPGTFIPRQFHWVCDVDIVTMWPRLCRATAVFTALGKVRFRWYAIQRAPNVHQRTCTSRWAENSKEWKFFLRRPPCTYVACVQWWSQVSFRICENGPWKKCILTLSLEIATFQGARKSCRNFSAVHFLIWYFVVFFWDSDDCSAGHQNAEMAFWLVHISNPPSNVRSSYSVCIRGAM